MSAPPLVSVVMSCYNAGEILARAIESVLSQSFQKFEFIIIEDGSTDNTLDLLKAWSQKDDRIHLVLNEKNLGLAHSLNKGIAAATGKYIARMDADDKAHASRFEKQVTFLESNPSVDIVGTGIVQINQKGEDLGAILLPEHHKDIVKRAFKKTMLFHPTILARKEVFSNYGYYDNSLRWAEDSDLWLRIYDKATFHNLQEPLLDYTVKEKLQMRHVKDNLSVKTKNLKRRGLMLRHLPTLMLDVMRYTQKMILP